jgi:hypothetical protein|nr:MAG TPA_asm: mindbomb E3 ubiquitin protein ligase ubiquitin ligase [Caudoviricetes sp.]
MKYKIGDLVKVRDDLQEDKMYGGCSSINDMLKFRGTLDIIENIDEDGNYHLANNNNPYVWSEDMLEPVVIKDDLKESTNIDGIKEGNNMDYKIRDIVRIKDNLKEGEKYGDCYVVEGMLKYRGTTDTIYYIDTVGDLYLSDKDNTYVWHKDMVEPVTMKDDLKHEIKEKNNMEYEIGDIVKVREGLQKGEIYGGCEVLETMLEYRGKMYVIVDIDFDGDYSLKSIANPEDTNYYSWHKDMLEPVEIKESTTPKMDRLGIYQYLLNNLEETYKAKNNDYGNSFADTYEKFGCVSFLVRITDEYNKLLTLCDPNIPEQRVKKIDDTILDLANSCLLWLVEREYKNQ